MNAPSQVLFEGGQFEVIYERYRVILTHYQSEPACPAYPVADFNKDCLVNLADFAVTASQWLECNLVPQKNCL